MKTGRSIREIVLERGLMPEDELDRALDVLALTKGGVVVGARSADGRLKRRRASRSNGVGSPGRG